MISALILLENNLVWKTHNKWKVIALVSLCFGRYVMYGEQNVLRETSSKLVSIFACGIQEIFACGIGNPGLWNP